MPVTKTPVKSVKPTSSAPTKPVVKVPTKYPRNHPFSRVDPKRLASLTRDEKKKLKKQLTPRKTKNAISKEDQERKTAYELFNSVLSYEELLRKVHMEGSKEAGIAISMRIRAGFTRSNDMDVLERRVIPSTSQHLMVAKRAYEQILLQ